MDQLLEKFITTGGPLVGFVLVVYFMSKNHHKTQEKTTQVFLDHMSTQAALNREMHHEMHNNNVENNRETREAIKELSGTVRINSNDTKDATAAIVRLCLTVDRKALG